MKRSFFFLCLLGAACGSASSSDIPELPAPSTSATTPVTARTLSQTLVDTLVYNDDTLSSHLILTSTDDDMACTTGDDRSTKRCPCTAGGTIAITFSSDITIDLPDSDESDSVVVTTPYTLSFNDCIDNHNDDSIALNGTLDGIVAVTYTADTITNYTATLSSADACTGLSANGSSFGLDITETLNGDGEMNLFSGSFCFNEATIEFDSVEDLESQVELTQ